MAIELPTVIASYFAADATESPERVARCFTDTAIVTDEGKTHEGRGEIEAWKAAASTKYNYTVEPFALVADAERFVVTSRLEGDFPGSPLNLRYIFALKGEQIAALAIVP